MSEANKDTKATGGILRMTRRSLLQALVSVPVLGVFVDGILSVVNRARVSA